MAQLSGALAVTCTGLWKIIHKHDFKDHIPQFLLWPYLSSQQKKRSSEPTSGNIQEGKEGRQFKASVYSIQMYLDAGTLSLCPLQ